MVLHQKQVSIFITKHKVEEMCAKQLLYTTKQKEDSSSLTNDLKNYKLIFPAPVECIGTFGIYLFTCH
jgi:hypothetical protein